MGIPLATDWQIKFWKDRFAEELRLWKTSNPGDRWYPILTRLRDHEQMGVIQNLIARIEYLENEARLERELI
jgi:hypothetical protein